ncbi:hypothetical protein KBY82_12680 [Cyanobium sp. AMD-g]|uniref:hypothetical protein n=1 Tax=Cyanobium sp. AMD-g TaxID=2823699 RepID=UPI0020CC5BF6|nr:hypothetical protein [Cyanobium sp. AMD-g]MCP9931635.1 hypothetical protein [Cyanobium sp. AMD-g]
MPPPSPAPGCPYAPAPAQGIARRNRRAWWAGFTFNGITRCEKGTYALVGGVAEGFCVAVELSDAERNQLLALNRKPSSRH